MAAWLTEGKPLPIISDVRPATRQWTGQINIVKGVALPCRVTTYFDGACRDDLVDLHDHRAGVTIYGYVEECGDDFVTILLNSINPESRYDASPPQVFVKGVE